MRIINDASVFEIYPPVRQKALFETVSCHLINHRAITMRAGGTSLGGQAIGSSMVIDVSKHLTNILDYRPEDKEIDVEPGVI